MSAALRILIAGGGIGGLSAALALQRLGHHVRVFERSSTLGEVGAGLTLTPNATRVLEALGLWPALAPHVVIPAQSELRDGLTGKQLAVRELGEPLQARYGAAYCHVHRADLHGALARAVQAADPQALTLDDAFIALEHNDEAQVRVRFTRSGTVTGDVLIGADGLRSSVRDALFGRAETRFAGYVAWRGLAPMAQLPARLREIPACMSVGPRNLLLRYPVSGGTLMNVACIGRTERWAEESWSTPATHAELLEQLRDWHEDAAVVVRAIPAERLFKWGLFERDELPRWQVARCALLGDAAHPMLPFLGQGAVMALEDAAVLARALAETPAPGAALARYTAARLARASTVTRLSADNGRALVPPDEASFQPGSHSSAATLGLMAYDPLNVALP